MANTGTGWGIPVSGGGGTGLRLATAFPRTLLPLATYAKIMGLNPMHFAGAVAPTHDLMPTNACNDIWHKYEWQDSDKVSLWEVAEEIQTAEEEIANFIGYYPAPYWIENELIPYPRVFARDQRGNGRNIQTRAKAIHTKRAKFINPGQRTLSLVGTATTVGGSLAYTDEDSDGYYETATVTLPTTLTDISELKLFFTGLNGQLEWEIRPVRSKELSGGNVVFVLDSWLLIDPDLYEALPTSAGALAIDVSTVANFVTSVEVYREYIDTTQASVQFYWENGYLANTLITCPTCGTIGCTVCDYDSQDGCAIARNHDMGEIAVYPASYDSENTAWNAVSWVTCTEPHIVRISYLSGAQSQEYLQSRTHDPLSLSWAQVIAWIATARLPRPLCSCGVVQDRVNYLARDMAHFLAGDTFFLTPDAMNCPFGTRRGEVMAWRRMLKLTPEKRLGVAVI
jgi:hypothetical protein